MKGGGELLFSYSRSSSKALKQEEGLLGVLNEFHFKLKTFYVLLFQFKSLVYYEVAESNLATFS